MEEAKKESPELAIWGSRSVCSLSLLSLCARPPYTPCLFTSAITPLCAISGGCEMWKRRSGSDDDCAHTARSHIWLFWLVATASLSLCLSVSLRGMITWKCINCIVCRSRDTLLKLHFFGARVSAARGALEAIRGTHPSLPPHARTDAPTPAHTHAPCWFTWWCSQRWRERGTKQQQQQQQLDTTAAAPLPLLNEGWKPGARRQTPLPSTSTPLNRHCRKQAQCSAR